METPGTLIDKLIIVNLKIFHEEIIAHDLKAIDKEIANAKRKINVLNNQRNSLIEELDTFLKKIISGEIELKIFSQFKNYQER